MWYLTNVKTQYVYYLVSQPTGYTVGRTGTDVIITGDESISRNHAMLQPYRDVLNLTDTGSRYGSFVYNNIAKPVEISKAEATALNPGDKIRFGRFESIWQVGKVDFQCLTSTLIMNDELKTILDKIGVELVSSFTEGLTHLIMPTITITSKFLQCLIAQVPIVKPEFFQTIDRDCIGNGKALPAVKDFVPVCIETYMRNEPHLFQPNPSRRVLFKGKEFIFFNTVQFSQFESIVKMAGGVCFSAKREKIAKSRFVKPNVVAIKLSSSGSSQSQSFDTLSEYISSHGHRMVPDMEIGLALIFCSTEKYCNPKYNFAFNVEECYSSAEGGDTLAKSTEQQTEKADTNVVEIHTIPETEPHNEAKQRDTAAFSKTNTMSTRTRSSFLVPKVEPPNKNVPIERRKSKRMQEALKGEEQTTNHEDSNLPKRARRSATPVESVSYSPVVDSKPTETERESSELHIPETQPTPALPHALHALGFRAVNRDAIELGNRTRKEPPKARSANNLQFNLDDDEMLMFDELAPRKKPRVEKSKSPTVSSASGAVAVRNNRTTPVEEEDLFCFDEMATTQQRRTAKQRKSKQTAALDAPANNVSNSSVVSSRPIGAQNRNASNDSTLNSYREFIKPIQPSVMGWLSSTMCGLKVTNENGEENSFNRMKIKSEPLDETDDPHGIMSDSKKWNISIEIPVRDISMKLVAHRPIDVSGREISCITSDGQNNFKAFVKKRNYLSQQLVWPTESVCFRDDNQCA